MHTLRLETHPFLADHRLGGRPVLPLASAVDLIAWTAGLATPFALADVRVERGVMLFGDEARIEVVEDGGRWQLREVRPSGRRVVAFSAVVAVPGAPPMLEAPDVCAGLPFDLVGFYSGHTFHGPLLQGIDGILGRNDTTIDGRVHTSHPALWQPADPRPEWHVDPLVIDGAFQLALYQSAALLGRKMVPLTIEALAWMRRPKGPTVEVRLQRVADPDLCCHVVVWDDSGLVGFMRGVRARLL